MKRWAFRSTSFSVYRNVYLLLLILFNRLLPNDLYTLLAVWAFFSVLLIALAKTYSFAILACVSAVAIVNVYGFQRWLFRNVYYFILFI